VNDYTFLGYALVGKMIVMEVTMKDPPAVFVAVLVFCPSFKLFPDKCSHFRKRPFGANALVIVGPAPYHGIEDTYQSMCRDSAIIPDYFLNFVLEGLYSRLRWSDDQFSVVFTDILG
jgi:hypothetical protein